MSGVDTRALRNVLGCFATGVAVITTRTADGRHVGVTVNSFAAVSLDPPLTLFSLARSANVLNAFLEAEHFLVNILAAHQGALSNNFARPSTAEWDDSQYCAASNGCAQFAGIVASIECAKVREIDGGDHVIVLGQVIAFQHHTAKSPLLFYRGAYGTYAAPRKTEDAYCVTDGALVCGWG